MKSITAIIIDDEKRARRVLSNLLQKSEPTIEILCECGDVPSAVAKIKALKPQVIFLDVQMPNFAGYEIVNFFDQINFEIIFVTAYNEYAIKAFELSAIDYLVKPIDRNKLVNALNRLSQRLVEQDSLEQYQILLESIKSKEHQKLIIPELGNRRIYDLKSLIAVEADGAYSKIYAANEKPITVSKNLKYFEEVLPQKDMFFRSHRGWIINLNCVVKMNKTSGLLLLTSNIEAKLSRSRYSDFERAIS